MFSQSCEEKMTTITSKRLILVVDDDPMFVQFATEVLRHADFDTAAVQSGEEALAFIAATPPDFVLLDIVMPGLSGLEVASALRQQDLPVPFMFVSAVDDARTARRAAQYGAHGYLIKPVDGPRVLSALTAALARSDEIAQLRRSEASLHAALTRRRETSLAVGLLMGKFHTNRSTAFKALREHARATRQKVEEAAAMLLLAEETVNSLNPEPSGKRER
jgi:response regulator NasT